MPSIAQIQALGQCRRKPLRFDFFLGERNVIGKPANLHRLRRAVENHKGRVRIAIPRLAQSQLPHAHRPGAPRDTARAEPSARPCFCQ